MNGVKCGDEEIEMMEKRNEEKLDVKTDEDQMEDKKAEKNKADEENMEND